MRELKIEGMTCGHCVSAIKSAVQSLDRNAKIEIDLNTGSAKLESEIDDSSLAAAIEEEGYVLTSVREV
ncbi:copper chaperone [Leptospira fletcheri]|uniref:Copper chaperone n=1 Tax=Leptospira fletcheri TaxID=2484981 RepID=A0A4R9GFE6_9LEPT|nr:cation transporter [Leptospira fletcheri]TGK11370.1 copper chaperone [Leptospira fletcheri]